MAWIRRPEDASARPGRWISSLLLVSVIMCASLASAAAQSTGPGEINADGCRELLVDGGFEQNGQGWTQVANPSGRSLISDFYHKSGTRNADMSGLNNTQDRLSQALTLPTDVNQIVLAYWWAYQTEEPDLSTPWDKITVQLYRPNGTLLATLASADYTGLTDWVWYSARSDLTQYVGQTVVLRFTTETDASRPTRFFVDDVSVKGCVRERVYLPLIQR